MTIQNDIGETGAHVIMVHADEPGATAYPRARHASPSSSAFFRATPQR